MAEQTQNQDATPIEQRAEGQPESMQQTEEKASRRPRVKSPYLFPVYDFNTARLIAETIERDGAGSLTEETLAITLKSSTKSSGFQLKALTARQFGLVTKQGSTLTTTPLAKAIFKPTSEVEKQKALAESFLKIPLFREVANKFKGQGLPESQTFRNILEREFKIDSKRIGDAERVLMDSARDAGVLVKSGNLTYLSVEKVTSFQSGAGEERVQGEPGTGIADGYLPPKSKENKPGGITQQTGMLPTIAEEDLLALAEDDFENFWTAFGKLVRARAERNKARGEATRNKIDGK